MSDSPAAILYDADGIAMAVENGVAIPADTRGLLVAGRTSGGNSVFVKVGTNGSVHVELDGASLPVPMTNTNLDVALSTRASQTTVASIETILTSIKDTDGVKKITDPLPAGSNLIGRFHLRSPNDLVNLGDATNPVRTDPTGTTAQPISASSLPLPTGAATETSLVAQSATDNGAFSDGTSRVVPAGFVFDEVAGTALTENDVAAARIDDKRAQIYVIEDAATRGRRLTITVANAAKVDGSAVTQPISAVSLPLPTGASTEATLATILTTSAFQARINTLGQKTMANSTPIVIASDQTVIPISDNGNSLTVDGTVTANQGTAAALSGYWPVRVTDGTNTLPTMDVAARAGFVKAFGTDAEAAAPTQNPVRVAGWDGTNLRTVKTDTSGRIVTVPATGSLSGFANGQIVLASTTVTACRSTTYTEPSSNAQRSIASANANDTSAGTGARTLRITYYSLSAGVITGPFTEDVTLNGTTPVNTVSTTICFIERIHVLTVGSTGSNVGIITLYGSTAGGGGTVWTIAATANQTFSCHHYVPTGSTCNVSGLLLGIKGADTTGGFLRAKNPADANAAEVQISDGLRAPSSGQSFRSYSTPIDVSGPSRITGYIAADSTSSRTYYMSFDFYEE